MDLIEVFRMEFFLGTSNIWNILCKNCLTTKMRVPKKCHGDMTKVDQ